MKEQEKDKILSEAREHVASTVTSVENFLEETTVALAKSKEEFKSLSAIDRVSEMALMRVYEKRAGEAEHLALSPYFVRCDVIWEGEQEVKSLYFGKFSHDPRDVYSWVAPASSVRFEDIGQVEYERPDGQMQRAQLVRKDQYVIAQKKITFLATESQGSDRELVYQEHFTNRKTGFVLPEIVAQMEKAQDQVIRAHHKGPFVISGPAGSGKTTLAFHRVAYLASAPDLAETYTPQKMVIFVQDSGAREYFSHLLPELGIEGVKITTFHDWATDMMGLTHTSTLRHYDSEADNDLYLHAKLQALRSDTPQMEKFNKRNPFTLLAHIYGDHLTPQQKNALTAQKKNRHLDYVDLTVLLRTYRRAEGSLGKVEEVWKEGVTGKFYKKKEFVPESNVLVLVDEFQNYLPEQIELMRSCVTSGTGAMIYVGDMAQQIHLGTITAWDQVGNDGEYIEAERQVTLHKVYRNTKSILSYIADLGYDVEIPDELRTGDAVIEAVTHSTREEIELIQEAIGSTGKAEGVSIGILGQDHVYLEDFTQEFADVQHIHIMTIRESQGLEFDRVFLVGMSEELLQARLPQDANENLHKEKSRIKKDLLYIALTRPINHLHIYGRKRLRDLVENS